MPNVQTTAPDRRKAAEELFELALSMPPRWREKLLDLLQSPPDEAPAADCGVAELYVQLSDSDREMVDFLVKLLVAVDLCRKEQATAFMETWTARKAPIGAMAELSQQIDRAGNLTKAARAGRAYT